jgi:hypothetical protein
MNYLSSTIKFQKYYILSTNDLICLKSIEFLYLIILLQLKKYLIIYSE